jgi:hypothetical protein
MSPAHSYRRLLVAVLVVLAVAVGGCRSGKAQPHATPSAGPGWRIGSAAPSIDPSAPFDLAAALDTIRHRDFTPAAPTTPLVGPLRAIKGTCTGSINGRCMEVFFFNGQQLVDSVHAGLVDIVSQNGTEVVLSFPRYQHGDPGCCPTGEPTIHTVRLGGNGIVANPPIPSDPNNTANQ